MLTSTSNDTHLLALQRLNRNRYDISVIDSTLPMIICSPSPEIAVNIDYCCVMLTSGHEGYQLIAEEILGDRLEVYSIISNALVNDASCVDCILIRAIYCHWRKGEPSRMTKILVVRIILGPLITVNSILSTSGGKQCSLDRQQKSKIRAAMCLSDFYTLSANISNNWDRNKLVNVCDISRLSWRKRFDLPS